MREQFLYTKEKLGAFAPDIIVIEGTQYGNQKK